MRGALIGSGAGIPAALGVNFAAGMAGSLAEQKIAKGRLSPVRAAVDGVFNAIGGKIYTTNSLKNAFIRGALEGAFKGGAYNIADVLDNKLRNAYGSKKPTVRSPRNPRGVQPARSRCPQKECVKSRPLAGMNYPGKGGRGGSFAPQNDRFSLGSFVRDMAIGAVMGGLASVAFYGAGKGVEALKRSVERRRIQKIEDYVVRAANERVPYIVETYSKKEIGPCFSTIYDPRLKRLYYGINYKSGNDKARNEYKKWLDEEAHRIIRNRTSIYQEAINGGLVDNLPLNHDTRLAAHSEVRALDLALKVREEVGMTVDETNISELFLYNIDMKKYFKGEGLIPKDRCENCRRITDGIHVIRHK